LPAYYAGHERGKLGLLGGRQGTRELLLAEVIAKSLEEWQPVEFNWLRPPGESARLTGGPLIQCGKRE
jgi:hypothetical protein